MNEEIRTRRGTRDDFPFIVSYWLNSYFRESYFAMRIKKDIFFESHKAIINLILNRSSTKSLIAYHEAEPTVSLGFLVYEDIPDTSKVVHFCFVKEHYRKMGIAQFLFESAEIEPKKSQFTHWTFDLDDIKKNKLKKMIYNPYRL